jgi:hypothetical protein
MNSGVLWSGKEICLVVTSHTKTLSKILCTAETNVFKAYALLWEQSSRDMQNKMKAHPNYATKIRGSPMKTLA